MGITLIIVGGIVVLTALGGFIDIQSKRQGGLGGKALERIETLEREVTLLRGEEAARADKIERLESELRFVGKLIEDRSREGGRA